MFKAIFRDVKRKNPDTGATSLVTYYTKSNSLYRAVVRTRGEDVYASFDIWCIGHGWEIFREIFNKDWWVDSLGLEGNRDRLVSEVEEIYRGVGWLA